VRRDLATIEEFGDGWVILTGSLGNEVELEVGDRGLNLRRELP
jgi:hypothetical protein